MRVIASRCPLFPYTTLFRSVEEKGGEFYLKGSRAVAFVGIGSNLDEAEAIAEQAASTVRGPVEHRSDIGNCFSFIEIDRKSTRLNYSHQITSYAVVCLKKKK